MVISENCYIFIVLKYKEIRTNIAMITESKVIEIFCMADDFCKFFDTMMAKYTLPPTTKRKYHRDSTMSKAEIMLILILFHDSGYRCLKHFYQEKVCKYMRHFFPKVVSYNRFVEFMYGKLVGDKGYISKNLFQRLFANGIQLITKLKSNMKGALMSLSDKLLLRKRAIIETVNDEFKNIAQVEHSRHRTFDNFMGNLLAAIAAYCCLTKKPCINVTRKIDTQLALF